MQVGLTTTPSGRRIEVARELEAPPRLAWELLTDTRYWPAWGPAVTDVRPSDTVVEKGTMGRIQVLWTAWVPFHVESCSDGRWTWSVFGRSPPAEGHRVDDLGGDRCRIAFEVPLWAPWYVPLCLRALGNLVKLCDRHASEED